jgi:hypothetical protein
MEIRQPTAGEDARITWRMVDPGSPEWNNRSIRRPRGSSAIIWPDMRLETRTFYSLLLAA